MTCIAGLVYPPPLLSEIDKNALSWVFLGADSAGMDSWWNLTIRRDPKVFLIGEPGATQMLAAITGSFRTGQILRYSFTPPEHPQDMDTDRYMATLFIDKLRLTMRDHFFAEKKDEVESLGGQSGVLIGYRGSVYTIYSDYHIGISSYPFAALGSGGSIAIGSLHTTNHPSLSENFALGWDPPITRLAMALDASATFNASVRPPFHIMCLKTTPPGKDPIVDTWTIHSMEHTEDRHGLKL